MIVLLQQDPTPFKSKEEFEVKLAFEFRDRPTNDPNKLEYNQSQREYARSKAIGPLPYLYLNVRVLKPVSDEVRIRVVENDVKVVLNKKFDMSTVLNLDMGYTDDIKDRVSAHQYTVYYLTADKKALSKVVINFEENGTYSVNGEVRGKI